MVARLKAVFYMSILALLLMFSLFLSHFIVDSDFPVYYYAASTIIDSNSPNKSVYEVDTFNKYFLPEHVEPAAFIYSMAAAYIFAPMALMPYYIAKALMIFINIVAYLGALIIILRLNRVSGRWFIYSLALSCLWIPFIQNLRSGQVNALLLLLVAIAASSVIQKRPILCGLFLGVASLFKLFPIGIAMILGLKNWRIIATCILVFSATFLIPGALEWFPALGNMCNIYTPFYPKLTRFGSAWFYLYVIIIAGTTALITYRCKGENYAMIISFAISAVLLTMPIIQYYHLTLLIFTYIYLITSENRNNRILITANIVSAVLISFSFIFTGASDSFYVRPHLSYSLLWIGLFLSWTSLAWRLNKIPT
jgi:hypothetical protein